MKKRFKTRTCELSADFMGRAIVIDYGHKFAAQVEVSLILTETKLICQLIC